MARKAADSSDTSATVAEAAPAEMTVAETAPAEMTVEAGCAMCTYDMEGAEECVTALMIDGKPYLLAGAELDAHEVGLCDSAKQVAVTGSIKDGKFVADSIMLVAVDDHGHDHDDDGHKH